MATPDLLPRRPLATYRRSHPVEDEETVPDSEDSISHGQARPPDDDGGNPTSSPIKAAQSTPPRPPRAVYRTRKRAPSPLPLSYSSMAPAEEVIPDSEDNGRNAATSDDGSDGDGDDTGRNLPSNARQSASLGLADWKQKLREIDDQYNADERTQGPHRISRTMPNSCIGYGPTSRYHLHHASYHPRQTRRRSSCLEPHERRHLLHLRRMVNRLRCQKRGQRERERRVHIPKPMKRLPITISRPHPMPSIKKGSTRNNNR